MRAICISEVWDTKKTLFSQQGKTQWLHLMAETHFYNQQLTQATSNTDASLMPTITP